MSARDTDTGRQGRRRGRAQGRAGAVWVARAAATKRMLQSEKIHRATATKATTTKGI